MVLNKYLRSLLGGSHHELVFVRRIRAIANAITPFIAPGKVLDVGCGNGMLGALLLRERKDVEIFGVDVHLRPNTYIPVTEFDGHHLPFPDKAFDSVMLIDVLHHVDNPAEILKDCLRVSRGNVVIKDHFYQNPVEYMLLKGMDWVGNAPHGVRLPYNYFNRKSWRQVLDSCNAIEIERREYVEGLYPIPLQYLIGQGIQFVSVCVK